MNCNHTRTVTATGIGLCDNEDKKWCLDCDQLLSWTPTVQHKPECPSEGKCDHRKDWHGPCCDKPRPSEEGKTLGICRKHQILKEDGLCDCKPPTGCPDVRGEECCEGLYTKCERCLLKPMKEIAESLKKPKEEKCKCLEGWPHICKDGEPLLSLSSACCPCTCHKPACLDTEKQPFWKKGIPSAVTVGDGQAIFSDSCQVCKDFGPGNCIHSEPDIEKCGCDAKWTGQCQKKGCSECFDCGKALPDSPKEECPYYTKEQVDTLLRVHRHD